MSVPLKELPPQDRPRERLLRVGPENLSDVELLAILIGTGTKNRRVLEVAQDLLHHCGELHGLLTLQAGDANRVAPGLGEAKMCRILAAVQLGIRAAASRAEQTDLSNPRAVYEYVLPRFGGKEQEEFLVILLNAKNRVIHVETVSRGTLTASLVHPREIFKSAIRRSAHAMILAHNHPSGDPAPSREDREVTQRLIHAGKLLGIEVLDHVVVGRGRYVSFRERGLVEWS